MGGWKDQLRWSWREDRFRGVYRLGRRVVCRALTMPLYRAEQKLRAENDARYPEWMDASLPDEQERAKQAAAAFSHGISFLIPTWNTRPDLLFALAASLQNQTNPNWEACFYDGHSTAEPTRKALKELEEKDARFHVVFGEENLGISGNTNVALAMAEKDYCALCDHDDLLAPDAVYCLLVAAEKGADFIYSDEDKVDETGTRYYDPHLKGEYAPDSLRSGNYMCHIMAAKTSLLREIGGLRSECDGSQDHDLALRLAACAKKIVHIPRILYHWRMLSTSASHEATERCVDAAVRAVKNQMTILDLPGEVFRENMVPRIHYRFQRQAKISLIFTGSDMQLRRLRRHTDCHFHEVLTGGMDSVYRMAQKATGEYLLFAAPGLIPEQRSWVEELLMYAQRKDVACAGAPLLKPNGLYVHAGYAVDVPGGAVSYHHGSTLWGRPYQLSDRITRNVTGVCSGWMMIRRELFLALGGFGEYTSDLRGAALGMRAIREGYVNVLTPYARAWVRGKEPCLTGPAPEEDLLLLEQEGEPKECYYSPLFEREKGTMSPDFDRIIPAYEGEMG